MKLYVLLLDDAFVNLTNNPDVVQGWRDKYKGHRGYTLQELTLNDGGGTTIWADEKKPLQDLDKIRDG